MNIADLVNTPGWYYAIAYWLACILFISRSRKRVTAIRLWGIEIFFLVILIWFMKISNGVVELFVPSILVCFFIVSSLIYCCCEMSSLNVIYVCVRAFITGEFAASFEWQIYYYAVTSLHVPKTIFISILFLIVNYSLIYWVLYSIEKRIQIKTKNIQITMKELLSVVIIGIAVFIVSNLGYMLKSAPINSYYISEIFLTRTLVDFGGVTILFAYHLQLEELHMRFEVERLQNILNMQYANYEMSEKSINLVHQKYHDLKYQIQVLKDEIISKESIEHLNQIEKEIKVYEAQNKTGNKILDTILTAKSIYCQSNEIELTCVVDGAAVCFMDVMDISTLFGNALDNAIESVKRITNKEKRLIHLMVKKQKDFVRIRVENCYNNELDFENGLPVTTKKDKKYHGYGLKSIQNTVKKYNGSVTINTKENWFELRILIPVPQNEN